MQILVSMRVVLLDKQGVHQGLNCKLNIESFDE